MKFCPVVPEICHGQVHGARKERRITRTRTRRRIIIIRNGAKTISLQTLFGRLNKMKFVIYIYTHTQVNQYRFMRDDKTSYINKYIQVIHILIHK